jgi:SAM-dependent methyltransferase
VRITGERIVTNEGGFNPTWQRHTANYLFAADSLAVTPTPGRVLDLGCGSGHAAHLFSPRWSVGVDLDHAALAGQKRAGVQSDIRRLPFCAGAFSAVVCLHAVEHVPDPERVVAECSRVVAPGGLVVMATPNRLTFGRPDEVIDPYHFVEFSPDQLRSLCAARFPDVTLYGLVGSAQYMEFFQAERRKLDRLLGLDPLRLRRFVPRKLRQQLYDWRLTQERRRDASPVAGRITRDDFSWQQDDLDDALDLIAVCRRGG